MIKKTITYVDFNNQEQTEEFYFNITEAEWVNLDLQYPDGIHSHLETVSRNNDTAGIMHMFRELINLSYGVRSDDGRFFDKSEEATDRFTNHAAYSNLFLELVSDVDVATDFFVSLVPDGAKRSISMSNSVTNSKSLPMAGVMPKSAKKKKKKKKNK